MARTSYGKIVVIEGPDGCGKGTVSKLVLAKFNTDKPFGVTAVSCSFPNYNDFFGKQVRAYLDGDAAHELIRVPADVRPDPLLASLPYAADRYKTFRDELYPVLKSGRWLILDRYEQSNTAHQGAKIEDLEERDEFQLRLEVLEHAYFQVPNANLVVLLDLPDEIRETRTSKRRAEEAGASHKVGHTDIHEQNKSYMAEVAHEYRRLAAKNDWPVVQGVEDGRELTPEEVADRAYNLIVERFR